MDHNLLIKNVVKCHKIVCDYLFAFITICKQLLKYMIQSTIYIYWFLYLFRCDKTERDNFFVFIKIYKHSLEVFASTIDGVIDFWPFWLYNTKTKPPQINLHLNMNFTLKLQDLQEVLQ